MFIRSLRAFLALHHHGTVAAAAGEIHLSAAAVSVQLKNLEQKLGVELFIRTKRSLRLTAAGHRLIPHAEQMIAAYEQMKSLGNTGVVAGILSLGIINSALTGVLPGLLRQLKLKNPRLEIKIIAGISSNLMAQVDAGVLDAAIVTQPPKRMAANLRIHHLYSEPFVLIMPAHMTYTGLANAMASTPYVAFDRSTWAGRQIDEFLAGRGIHVRPEMELNSLDAVTAVVSQGLGASIVPLIRGSAWHGDLSLRVIRLPDFDRAVSLVERKEHCRSDLTAALLSLFIDIESVTSPAEPAVMPVT
jgi:DNA-binding transcriptional LysR family regulator